MSAPASATAVFDTVVPRNVRLSEAPSHGLPALIYDLDAPARRPMSGWRAK